MGWYIVYLTTVKAHLHKKSSILLEYYNLTKASLFDFLCLKLTKNFNNYYNFFVYNTKRDVLQNITAYYQNTQNWLYRLGLFLYCSCPIYCICRFYDYHPLQSTSGHIGYFQQNKKCALLQKGVGIVSPLF